MARSPGGVQGQQNRIQNRHTDTSKVEQRRKCAYIGGFGCTSEVADAFVDRTKLAEKHFDFRIPHQLACQKLARLMAKACTYMESNQLQKLPQACQKVAEQYRQLEAEAEKGDDFNSWRVMTKMHLFQHLCEMGSSCKDALKSWKGGLASKTCQPFPEFALAPPIASHCLPARGKPELEDQHNPCKTQQEKRNIFYNVYLLDPEASSKKMVARHIACLQEAITSDGQTTSMIQTNRKSKFPPWKGGGQRSRFPSTKAFFHTWTIRKVLLMSVLRLQEAT